MSEVLDAALLAPGLYPERRTPDEPWLDRWTRNLWGRVRHLGARTLRREQRIVDGVAVRGRVLANLADEELARRAALLRADLRAGGLAEDAVLRAFALIRETAARRVGMRPFDVQILGGWVLYRGMVAEMQTGEGKTLTATLPAAALALAGVPVHIITVNDYLATRDAGWMGPLYEALGLTVATVTHATTQEERRRAYRCDITYCTNKEVVFDYLRDRIDLGRRPGPIQGRLHRLSQGGTRFDRLRLRGLHYAIVDEADSVLIDEARVPLIISGRGDDTYEAAVYRQAMDVAARLAPGADYLLDPARRTLEWKDEGRARLEALTRDAGPFWNSRQRRDELVRIALTALHLYEKDRHYVVKGGKVLIVDEYTGRLMPGRSWEGGLHQLIETKESCDLTVRTEVLARISYQRFFRRYLRLAGMTGTAREAAGELWSIYRLPVVAVPTNRPMRRRALPMRLFPDAATKWHAVTARIAELHALGRPILVGTRTVAASEHLAALLAAAGLPCRVLNAIQDRNEAEIIAGAGERGRITVATNMAGRGTDIRLGPGVAELGGLHVLATEPHEARRIDRQLFGRCGRQGDPGSHEAFASLGDDLIVSHRARGRPVPPASDAATAPPAGAGALWRRRAIRRAQRSAERLHREMRATLLDVDESLDTALAFSGHGE